MLTASLTCSQQCPPVASINTLVTSVPLKEEQTQWGLSSAQMQWEIEGKVRSHLLFYCFCLFPAIIPDQHCGSSTPHLQEIFNDFNSVAKINMKMFPAPHGRNRHLLTRPHPTYCPAASACFCRACSTGCMHPKHAMELRWCVNRSSDSFSQRFSISENDKGVFYMKLILSNNK